MARAALRWKVDDLADATGLTWARVQQMERADEVPSAAEQKLKMVRQVLEEAGVVFIAEDDIAGPGVRVRKSRKDR